MAASASRAERERSARGINRNLQGRPTTDPWEGVPFVPACFLTLVLHSTHRLRAVFISRVRCGCSLGPPSAPPLVFSLLFTSSSRTAQNRKYLTRNIKRFFIGCHLYRVN